MSTEENPHPVTRQVDPSKCRHLDVVETIAENSNELYTECRSCGDVWMEVIPSDTDRDPTEEASYWRESWDEGR